MLILLMLLSALVAVIFFGALAFYLYLIANLLEAIGGTPTSYLANRGLSSNSILKCTTTCSGILNSGRSLGAVYGNTAGEVQVNAEFKDGVLKIHLAKTEKAKDREV